ncbi:protein farnesyltransferase subunit beta [Tanacetum coccineum]|uniref:Protein farnesyltransferase subunit beta n=1 Tax=Tanacetum coccineum TaxID=301880 RepID=A0ABQ5F2Z1_9ASTR
MAPSPEGVASPHNQVGSSPEDNHIEYLMKGLRNLGPLFVVLDANWPWSFYLILHSIAILGECVDVDLDHNAIDFLSRCQDEHGGHG